MRQKISTIFLMVLLAGLILQGCQKYEDGPFISFRSAEQRLCNPRKISVYTVNGADSIAYLPEGKVIFTNFLYDNLNGRNIFQLDGPGPDSALFRANWPWTLTDKNKNIVMQCDSSHFVGIFGKGNEINWKILRLTKKELTLSATAEGETHIVEMVEP